VENAKSPQIHKEGTNISFVLLTWQVVLGASRVWRAEI